MLVRHGVPMKMVQEWLGHSDYSTTANIYSHLGYESKEETAKAMLEALSFEEWGNKGQNVRFRYNIVW
ncbi:MAG: tyrosine-type recombinase/integrase [Lachnospiraceae bacterium]|nr:tyrosine-type recombinase/integrase [Lachnospiraceae bacterium]